MRVWTIEGTREDSDGAVSPFSREILGDESDPTESIAMVFDMVNETPFSNIKITDVDSGLIIDAVTSSLLDVLKNNNGRDVEG